MRFQHVRAIVFDAVGTLIRPDPPAAYVYAAVGKRFGSVLDRDEIGRRFRTAFTRQEEVDQQAKFRTSESREVERWRRIVKEVLTDVTDSEACFWELFHHFARPGAWRCEQETGGVLAQLAGRGYALALASNYDRRLRSVVAGITALAPLQHLVISSEVGWRKPAPEFYAAVCASLGAREKDVLHVGDDGVNDYEGALACGLGAILFDPRGQTLAGVARIRGLAELLDVME